MRPPQGTSRKALKSRRVPSQGLGLYPNKDSRGVEGRASTESDGGKREVVSSAERRKSLQREGVGQKKEVGKRHYVEGSRRWLKTHSLFSLSLNYSILLTIQITLFFIRSRKLIRDALILLSFFRGESVVMEKA